jgi:hypothetical protein
MLLLIKLLQVVTLAMNLCSDDDIRVKKIWGNKKSENKTVTDADDSNLDL